MDGDTVTAILFLIVMMLIVIQGYALISYVRKK
jgi:hypothetical protein